MPTSLLTTYPITGPHHPPPPLTPSTLVQPVRGAHVFGEQRKLWLVPTLAHNRHQFVVVRRDELLERVANHDKAEIVGRFRGDTLPPGFLEQLARDRVEGVPVCL